MEAQLKAWGLKINQLVAQTHASGVKAGLDSLMHVDELKALHAIAQAKLNEFTAQEIADRDRLRSELEKAWEELDAAFKKPLP
jgi:hypothetical protein